MKTESNLLYETPTAVVLDIRPEGVICGSATLNGLSEPADYSSGDDPFGF